MAADFYNTVEAFATAEFKDRGSRFIALLYPVTNVRLCKDYVFAAKKEHPKARHHCFAYRLGLDKNNFRASDDGEPSGTAGKPILGQIDSKNLTNILIIVVRYFGGTLLGVPGLIHAYKSAAAMALQLAPVVRKPVLKYYTLQFDYTQINDVMQYIKQFDGIILQQDLQLFCTMQVGIPSNRNEEAMLKISDIRDIHITDLKI